MRRTVAQRANRRLSTQTPVAAILVFGSVASGHVDEHSDVDILVVCEPQIISISTRQDILHSLGTEWSFNILNENTLFADSDEGLVDSVPISVHYQSVSWIATVLDEVLEQGAIQTSLLPFRPYTLPALLQRAWVLNDRHGKVEQWRQQSKQYPPLLKRNLLRHFMPLLHEQTEELVRSAQRNLGPMGFIFHLVRAADALRSILYAVNDIYDPADRRADQLVLPTLTNTPHNFVDRWRNVLEGPFTSSGTLHAAKEFQQLVKEVEPLAEAALKTVLTTAVSWQQEN